jgi:hypothetical protein
MLQRVFSERLRSENSLSRSLRNTLPARAFRQCTKKKTEQIIVFDDWWNLDYLKNACQYQIQFGRHCSQSPDEILSDVENALQVAFASEPDCNHLKLVRFTPDMAHEAVKNPNAVATGDMKEAANEHWSLMLDIPGDNYSDGGWSMVKGSVAMKGDLSNPADAMRRVCAIAKRKGSSIGSAR